VAISDTDRKLLWGGSGNKCSFPGCRCEVTQKPRTGDLRFTIGEEAHIVARTLDGPRGDHPLPLKDRDRYDNFILLCPTHHAVIDRDVVTYTVEKLHQIKRDHERWVRKRLEHVPLTVSLAKLPVTGPDLLGRDRELALLDQAWEDPNTNIVAFIAFGGVGKSAIVNHWLQRMAKDDYRGAHRVFGWSFYSQGQREHTVSADQFIDAALRFFSDPKPEEGSPWDKGERLAQFVRRKPTILALDGVEPLQSSVPGEMGRIHDPALDTLLRELSHGMDGLCVLTSRVDFPDLPLSDESGPCRRVNLERLSTEAGRHLLREADVKGLDHELDTAVEEYEGHALALVLLAEYLVKFLSGDIVRRDQIPPFPKQTRAGRHAFRVMEAYDKALEKGGMEAERAILRIIGLFDRPAGKGCLDALRRPPAVEGVTDAIVNLTDREWLEAVGMLRALRLITPAPDPDGGSVDAHPLVREWFGMKLEQDSPEGFRQGHGRLYEHLREHGKPTADCDEDTFEDLLPLLQAVLHGCRAGRHQEALDGVYHGRVHRGERSFVKRVLGAFSADLAAMSGFFGGSFLEPTPRLHLGSRGFVLVEAGFDLRALGRLSLASQVLRLGIDTCRAAESWRNAARSAHNLIEVSIATGDLADAIATCAQAEDMLSFVHSTFDEFVNRGYQAAALCRQGRLANAANAFREAERIKRQYTPWHGELSSIPGVHYCAFLLQVGEVEALQHRAIDAIRTADLQRNVLDVARSHLSLGCALLAMESRARSLGQPSHTTEGVERARCHIDQGVAGVRRAGYRYHNPEALLARAAFHRDFGDRGQAERDLKEALELSARFGLRLHETDARLLEGHLALDLDPPDLNTTVEAHKRADTLVQETGYHLRDADLLILEGRLLAKQGDKEAGRAKLEEAIRVAKREEKDGCVYQVAVDQAERYLREMGVGV
jgi:tetratricopeptide (TPR) repeat protein